LFLETISGKTNEFPIFWRLDSCRPIEFRDGQRDALGILAHRMSEDDVSGCPSSPKRNAGRFLRFHETKVLRRRSDPIRKKTQLQTHHERHDSANFLPGGLFPMSKFPNGSPFFVHKIKFGFINLEASQRRCRKVGGFFQREFLGEQRPILF